MDFLGIDIGKRVGDAVYVHETAIEFLPQKIKGAVLESRPNEGSANVVKIARQTERISYLFYPTFDTEAHPPLVRSITVNRLTRTQTVTDFSESGNPPILHRKEALVCRSYPQYETFRQLTEAEEAAGLFEYPTKIGFRREWERLLKRMRLRIDGHRLIEDDQGPEAFDPFQGGVARHRTAIVRYEPSRPVKALLSHGLLDGKQFFDYGCGQGDDVRTLTKAGCRATGWDPYFAPDEPKPEAEIVNLGFVLNIIEDPKERAQTLQDAWRLTKELLVVSVMHESQARNGDFRPFGDGILTSRRTFQKYFAQDELQQYLETTLGVEAISVSLGLFYVFKSDSLKHEFIARSVQRQIDWKELSTRERQDVVFVPRLTKYQKHQGLFDSFWQTCLELARIPRKGEFEHLDEIRKAAGSLPKALQILGDKFDLDALEESRRQRADDLLVYFCMAHFKKRIPFKSLPESLQYDIKAVFGNYSSLEGEAYKTLVAAADPTRIEAACAELSFGKNDSEFFQFHSSYLPRLPALLRAYVGCGSILYGGVEEADVIKIHKRTGKLSLMFYDDFWGKAHPELTLRIKILLRTQEVEVFDYSTQDRVQLLYAKDAYLDADHPKHRLFAKLTSAETKAGLLDFPGYGPDKDLWEQILLTKGWEIRGHQLRPLRS